MLRAMAIVAAVGLVGLLAGCRTDSQPGWDYGRAFHTVFENQKLDPNAGDGRPVEGMTGPVAAAAYSRYEKAKPTEQEKKPGHILDIRSGQ